MYAQRAPLLCYHPSVCLSVRLSHGWISRLTQLSPHSSPILLTFAGDSFLSGGIKQGRGGENKPFSSFKRQYLENGRRYV